MHAWWTLLGLGICVGGIAIACEGGDSDADGPCETGSERCECYANRTCDSGLTCLSEICVDDDEADNGGPGGSGGSSGGGESSSGGTDSDSGGSASDSGGSTSDAGGSASDSGGSTSDAGGSASDSGGSAGADGSSSGGSGVGGDTTTSTSGAQGGAGGSGTGGSGAEGSGGTGGPVEGNLIQNGDFSDGDAHWDLTLSVGYPVVDSANGEYCVQNPEYTYATFTLGYPLDLTEVFPIASGASYTLSYRVKGYASYELKIGQAAEPYTALAAVSEDSSAASSYVTQTHTIEATLGDPEAGLAITVLLGTSQSICFDDISLVEE